MALNRAELRLIRAARDREAPVPGAGSLHGIGAAGPVAGRDPDRPAYLLLFVVHSSHLKLDRDYWNEVIRRVTPGEKAIRYWGVCDAGNVCSMSQEGAEFIVVGFLDPYQMRIVATAEADGAALLYDPEDTLRSRVKRDQDPSATAGFINGSIR